MPPIIFVLVVLNKIRTLSCKMLRLGKQGFQVFEATPHFFIPCLYPSSPSWFKPSGLCPPSTLEELKATPPEVHLCQLCPHELEGRLSL